MSLAGKTWIIVFASLEYCEHHGTSCTENVHASLSQPGPEQPPFFWGTALPTLEPNGSGGHCQSYNPAGDTVVPQAGYL